MTHCVRLNVKTAIGTLFLLSVTLLSSVTVRAQTGPAWVTESSDNFTGRSGASTTVVNGKIYVMGGYDGDVVLSNLQVYDPIANSWSTPTTTGNFTPRNSLACAAVNGKIYAIGGDDNFVNYSHVEVFDPATNAWTQLDPGNFVPRYGLAAVVLNGKIYAIGGRADTGRIRATQVFDPATNTWTNLAPTITRRAFGTASTVNGKIYFMGGEGGNNGPVDDSVEEYDPATDTWSTLTMTGNFSSHDQASSQAIGGKIYFLGGSGQSNVEVFDPQTNSWSVLATTGSYTSRNYPTSAYANNNIYLIGGSDNNDNYLSTNEALTGLPLDDVQNGALPALHLMSYPNPLNDHVAFSFTLPIPADVRLEIRDNLGRPIAVVANETMSAGEHSIVWNPAPNVVANGTYICTLSSAHMGLQERSLLVIAR